MMTDFLHTSGSFSEMSSSIHEVLQKAAATWETLFPPIRVITWTSTLWKDVQDNVDNTLLNAIIALIILDVTVKCVWIQSSGLEDLTRPRCECWVICTLPLSCLKSNNCTFPLCFRHACLLSNVPCAWKLTHASLFQFRCNPSADPGSSEQTGHSISHQHYFWSTRLNSKQRNDLKTELYAFPHKCINMYCIWHTPSKQSHCDQCPNSFMNPFWEWTRFSVWCIRNIIQIKHSF